MTDTTAIRDAAGSDRARVAETLACAFDEDVVANWALRQDERRRDALRLVFRTFFDLYLPLGMTHVAGDGVGAALWAPHDRWRPPPWRELLLAPVYLRACGLSRLGRAIRGIESMDAHHPKTPHNYLLAIGVHPNKQRQGIASLLLNRMLDQCDRERKDAYLEATSLHNKALYLRHGFEVTREFAFGSGAPVLTGMLRKPRR